MQLFIGLGLNIYASVKWAYILRRITIDWMKFTDNYTLPCHIASKIDRNLKAYCRSCFACSS